MRMMVTSPVRNMTIMKLLKMENQWIWGARKAGAQAGQRGGQRRMDTTGTKASSDRQFASRNNPLDLETRLARDACLALAQPQLILPPSREAKKSSLKAQGAFPTHTLTWPRAATCQAHCCSPAPAPSAQPPFQDRHDCQTPSEGAHNCHVRLAAHWIAARPRCRPARQQRPPTLCSKKL